MDNVVFKSAFRGFDRSQVLEYIDKMSLDADKKVSEYEALQKELQSQIDLLKIRLNDSNERILSDKKQISELNRDISELQEYNDNLKNQIIDYRSQIGEKENEIARLKNDYAIVFERNVQLADENDEWRSKQAEIASCLVDAQVRANKIITDANNRVQRQQAQFEQNARNLAEKVTDVKTKVRDLEKQLSQSFEKLSEAIASMDRATSSIERKVGEYKTESGRLNDFNILETKTVDVNNFTHPVTVESTVAKPVEDVKKQVLIEQKPAVQVRQASKKTLTDSVLDAIVKLLEK